MCLYYVYDVSTLRVLCLLCVDFVSILCLLCVYDVSIMCLLQLARNTNTQTTQHDDKKNEQQQCVYLVSIDIL